MKNSPLKRKASLQRKTPIKRKSTLKAKKPMRRSPTKLARNPLRQSSTIKRKAGLTRKKRLNPISKNPRKVARRKIYEQRRNAFLAEHENCQVCGVHKDNTMLKSLDCHHVMGRSGKSPNVHGELEDNFINTATFMAICRECHCRVHENPSQARARGLYKPE